MAEEYFGGSKPRNRWNRTKRYFNLADPYPYNPATYRPRDKAIALVVIGIAFVVSCIVVLSVIVFMLLSQG